MPTAPRRPRARSSSEAPTPRPPSAPTPRAPSAPTPRTPAAPAPPTAQPAAPPPLPPTPEKGPAAQGRGERHPGDAPRAIAERSDGLPSAPHRGCRAPRGGGGASPGNPPPHTLPGCPPWPSSTASTSSPGSPFSPGAASAARTGRGAGTPPLGRGPPPRPVNC
jgi:hypothetical protein